jgi:kynureninase
MTPFDLPTLRAEFPILERSVYLISNSLGAMPRGAAAGLAEYAETWATRGVRAWAERWWGMGREVADRVARLIGAPPASVSMHENVTGAHAIVLSTLPPPTGPRRRIVCTEGDFPSTIYLCRAHESLGFELVVVPSESDLSVDVERVVDAIDDRTALVAVSHVLFRSSFVLDPAPVVERAHAVGAQVVLDVYQSAGILPLDVTALGVDFATGGCLKWLCGGPGNAFLYTRPDLAASLRPRITGWFAHPEPFAFRPDEFEPLGDAARMMGGTPSIPAWHAAIPGLDLLAGIGIEAVRSRSIELTRRLLRLVDVHGFHSVASRDPDLLGGTVAIDVPDGAQVARTLNARDFVVDYRPLAGIRVSPHVYNTEEEVDALVNELARIVRTKDYSESRSGHPVT